MLVCYVVLNSEIRVACYK